MDHAVDTAPWWYVWGIPVLSATAIALAIAHRDWLGGILPCALLLTWWDRRGGSTETERTYEITYAVAYAPWRLVGNRSLEWGQVQRVEVSEETILLYRSLSLSPVHLKLPEDSELRERIVSAVRAKTKRAKQILQPPAKSREQTASPPS